MKKIQILAIVLLIPAIQGLSKTENLIIEKLELNPPQNLIGFIINNNDVLLEWSPPIISKALWLYENGINSSKDLLGYNVYKDSTNIGFTSDTSFLEQDIFPGEYEYFVTAVYDEGESVPSNSVWIISTGPCDPPVNVTATEINEFYVEITWEPPITGNVTGFNLYKDGALLGFTTELSYTTEIWPGIYQFCVSSVCVGVESEPACVDSVAIYLAPPTNFWIGIYEPLLIELSWQPPEKKGLLGYNIYYKFNNPEFEFWWFTTGTNCMFGAYELGLYSFFVTALYNEGESESTDTLSILIDAIEDNYYHEGLMIFPNPAKNIINISSATEIKSLKIYNYSGQLIKDEPVSANFCQIITSDYNSGIYLFMIETENETITQRVFVE